MTVIIILLTAGMTDHLHLTLIKLCSMCIFFLKILPISCTVTVFCCVEYMIDQRSCCDIGTHVTGASFQVGQKQWWYHYQRCLV